MSKYKVGDKFIVEIKEVLNDELPYDTENLYRIDGFKTLVFDDYGLDKLQQINPQLKIEDIDDMLAEYDLKKASYEQGLQDAWELARKVALFNCDKEDAYSVTELKAIFNKTSLQGVFSSCTIQQALAKIEAYEESKAIKVGDVVFNAREDIKAVIIDSAVAEGAWHVYTEDCCVEIWKECEFKKIGRTVDIEHLLKQIRGNE